MRALPVPGGRGAEREHHVKHLARIVDAAPQLHQVGVGAEIARPHLGVRLKPARTRDDGAATDVVFAVIRRDAHPLDAAIVAVQADHARVVADVDAHAERDLAPAQELPQPAAHRVNDDAGLEVILPVDRRMLLGLEYDPDIAHPAHRVQGIVDHETGEHRVDPPLGHPVEVGEEIVPRIGREVEGLEQVLVDGRNDLPDLVRRVVGEAETGMGIARVAAEFALRRLLQHHDFLGTRLARRNGRLERRATPADDDDIACLFPCHDSSPLPVVAMCRSGWLFRRR